MRQKHILTVILLLLTTAAAAQAHTGSWKAIERLRPGTMIFVKAGRHVRCAFVRATDRELVCDPVQPVPIRVGRMVYRFERRIVHEVRLEHSDDFNGMVGGAIGAGAGAALGAASANPETGSTREGGAIFGALVGGLLGSAIGRRAPLLHGKVIYKR